MMKYKVLGTTDDRTSCDCCGREDLKSTVALEDEDGEVVYFGCVCAAKAMRIPAADVRRAAKSADDAKVAAENSARIAAMDAANKRWFSFLNAMRPGLEVFTQIEKLGGYQAARAIYATWCPECNGTQGVHTAWCETGNAAKVA